MKETENSFLSSLEETCFIAKYLLQNEELENEFIISLYRENKEKMARKEYNMKQIQSDFILLLMKENKLNSQNIWDELTTYTSKSDISDNIVDIIIADYFHLKRQNYQVDNDRLRYLCREIDK